MLSRSLVASAALLLALSLVACGGGGPSQEEYAADIDEVCERLNAEAEALTDPPPTAPDEIGAFAAEMRSLIEEGVQEIEGIERPEEGEAAELAEDYVSTLREEAGEAVEALDDVEEAAGDGLLAVFGALAEATDAVQLGEASEKARELGADECGEE